MTHLKQSEADRLLAMPKRFDPVPAPLELPLPGQSETFKLVPESSVERHTFQLDIHRGRISIKKVSYNHRVDTSIVLLRLCMEGRHKNPDGTKIGAPHVHRYREGFGDRFADELTIEGASVALEWFLGQIGAQVPPIVTDLFSE